MRRAIKLKVVKTFLTITKSVFIQRRIAQNNEILWNKEMPHEKKLVYVKISNKN